ncbi:MAG: hypothetical protein ABII10_00205 [Candidatus Paceibacterota bacterium]
MKKELTNKTGRGAWRGAWRGAMIAILLVAIWARFFGVTSSPPAPYWEEVALGYDAFSILETGKDHHGASPLVAFESFGDWKPSGYFYALVPFIKWFGLSVLAIRLPSMLAGVGIVIGLGVLGWQFSDQILPIKARRWLVLIALGLGAISPWLIQFSRGGWEVNLATFFILWGVITGWQAIATKQANRWRFAWLLLSILLLFAAMYTYHSARILAPVLGLVIGWQFIKKDLSAKLKNICLAGFILPLFLTVMLLQPFGSVLGTPILKQRLTETSLFSDLTIIEKSNELKALHGNSLLSRVIYHRFVLQGTKVAEQFLMHFDPGFLFVDGDVNPRHSTGYFGLFYPSEAIFLLVGIFWLLKHLPANRRSLLIVWLVVGILPAAMSKTVPHALRILPVAPVFLLLTAFGIWQSWDWTAKQLQGKCWQKKLFILPLGLFTFYALSFAAFFRHLLFVYPQQFSSEWQYGYEQMITQVEVLRQQHPDLPIYITREQGRPAMYYWFYTATNPVLVQQANGSVKKDQGEFLEFASLHFVNSLQEATSLPAIAVGSPDQFTELEVSEQLELINDLAGKPVWQLAIIE